jgi:hypothetical protein
MWSIHRNYSNKTPQTEEWAKYSVAAILCRMVRTNNVFRNSFVQVRCLFYLCLLCCAASNANVPLSLRHCSMLKDISVFGNQRPSVASVTRRYLRINLVCTAKYKCDVHKSHFFKCVVSNGVCHITT